MGCSCDGGGDARRDGAEELQRVGASIAALGRISVFWGIHVTGVARRRARPGRPLKDTRGSAGAHAPAGVLAVMLAGLSGGDEAPVAHRFAGDHDFKHPKQPSPG